MSVEEALVLLVKQLVSTLTVPQKLTLSKNHVKRNLWKGECPCLILSTVKTPSGGETTCA
jgi:hypothetical protein